MPLVLLLVAGGALAYYLLHASSSSSSDSSAATSTDGSGVFSPFDPTAPPQGGQDAASAAFQNTANGATTQAPGLMLPKLTLPKIKVPAPRDLTPQFQSQADYNLAVKLNPDKAHLIPHMIVQEGRAIKYEDVRGGSNTIMIPGR